MSKEISTVAKKEVVNYDTAMAEVNKWLDYKRIKQRKREAQQDVNEALAYAIMDGQLVLNEKMEWVQTLTFPIGESITKFVYKPRLTVFESKQLNKGVKQDDTLGKIIAQVSALTDQPKGVIEKVESGSDDYEIMVSIAIYFL